MFRNLRYYRLQSDWPESEDAVSEALQQQAFKPCGPLTERSTGWEPVCPDASDLLARRINGADLLRLRSQSRVLPHAAINEELEARVVEFRERMGEDPRPREKRRLKAETRDELMPKALRKSDRIRGFVDLKDKVIGIDSAQTTAAERFLRSLRAPFGDLNLRPLEFRRPVGELLTAIFLGDAPARFALGSECRMHDASDPGAKVRWTQFDLGDRSIRDHVINGMQLTHLAIVYDNILGCVLDENGVLTKMRFLGVDDDNDDELEPLARHDAGFVLATGTLRRLIGDLKKLLGGMK